MANQTISNPLKRSISGGHVATAEDIAYSTKTAGSGSLLYETIDVSMKSKIDSIASDVTNLKNNQSGTDASKVSFSYTEDGETVDSTVQEVLSEVKTSLGGITDLTLAIEDTLTQATAAAASATNAEAAYEDTKNLADVLAYGYYVNAKGNIVATYDTETKKYQDSAGNTPVTDDDGNITINNVAVTFVTGALTISSEYYDKFQEVLDVSTTLASTFDADANFNVISVDEYKNKLNNGTLSDGTIYFCYDGTAAKTSLTYGVNILRLDSTVCGQISLAAGIGVSASTTDSNAKAELTGLAYNTPVTVTLTPNSGKYLSGAIIDGKSYTSSPITLNVKYDITGYVTFADIGTISSISIATKPTNTLYYVGDELDTTGMIVKATYSSGYTNTLSSSDYTISGFNSDTAGTKTVTVVYSGLSDTFNVTVSDIVLSSISASGATTLFYLGDEFNTTGLVVTRTYNNGTTDTSAVKDSDYTVSTPDMTTEGTLTITITSVSDTSISTTYDIQISTRTVTLTVTDVENGSVSVTPEVEDNKFTSGTSVTVTATPSEGYNFVKWSENDDTNSTYTFTIYSDTTLTPIYEALSE